MPAGWQDATRNAAHNAGHRSLPERARRGGLFVVIIELGWALLPFGSRVAMFPVVMVSKKAHCR
jgi:hypothetical protein